PRSESRDCFRPSRRALLAPVPRILGGGRPAGGRSREPDLPPEALRGHAAVRLRVRVPELHRPGAFELEARVLRVELPPARLGQAEIRPRKRLPLPSEHPHAALSGHWECITQATTNRVASVLRIGSIVLRVDDLQRQTEFWEAALGYVRRELPSDDFM